ncbi:hypothetical protein BD413DRAFT_462578 [Trametes elegans]|nr:hypothetical protein BD413DRAFT_462578 [Trametes elegans]
MCHFTQSQGHTGAARLATPGRRLLAFHCVRVLSYLAFLLLLKFFSFWTRIAARSHETLCQLLGLPPCSAFKPGESAIVIVGGDDDVGRHVALSFSELGCTVFVLCPDQQAVHYDPQALGRYSDASSVSSLIQEWHKRIKRSGRLPWGLVAPIVLDMTSETQRTHAFETVDAYCATHNLHLVAVIVLPTSVPARTCIKPLASGRAGVEAWAEIVRKCLVQPISVVQDYANMLAAASGRVVLLLASGDQLERPTAHLGVLHAAAQLLRQELGSFGIKVSTVAAAPFAPLAMAKPLARTGDTARWGFPPL